MHIDAAGRPSYIMQVAFNADMAVIDSLYYSQRSRPACFADLQRFTEQYRHKIKPHSYAA